MKNEDTCNICHRGYIYWSEMMQMWVCEECGAMWSEEGE